MPSQQSLTMATGKDVHRGIRIVSFNMHGFTQGRVAIDEIITESSPDVFLLQEHWLTPSNLNKFDDAFTDYFTFGCSAMSKTLESGILRGRPYGGIMIMIKNNLRPFTETIYCSERYAIIRIGNCVIVDVYLPCVGSDDRALVVDDILTECWMWCERFSSCNIIFAGDFNADLSKFDVVSAMINAYIADHALNRCDVLFHKDNLITYDNTALNQHSCIDYFLTSSGDIVTEFDVLDPNLNFSDHYPVTVMCKINFPLNCNKSKQCGNASVTHVTQLRWDHADLASYYSYTGCYLQPVLDKVDLITAYFDNSESIDYAHAVNVLYADIVDILVSAANAYVPKHQSNFYKFWWDAEMSLLKDESIESNEEWKAAGKPRYGPIFDRRQACRLRYRRRIRETNRSTQSVYTNDLHECLLSKNGPSFWKCWRSKFETRNKCIQVDGSIDSEVVANKFANHFHKAYSCNNTSRAAELYSEYRTNRCNYQGLPLTEDFNVELVSRVIYNMKRGKAADLDSLTAEHLLFSHPILPCLLARLFNLILRCNYVPSTFKFSYTIPIPKLQDCRTKAVTTDDFRGIAISPIISKIYEHCILDRFGHFLRTSDNQFGFKKGRGCTTAIYTVRKSIEYFVGGGSTVNICSIDLSKAFDKVNHHALFVKLMKRHIPNELLSVLENWLGDCHTCVKWNDATSRFIKIDFGVRQGSVLSPYLFAVYVDDIVTRLHVSQRCFIALYADDILIYAPSITELQNIVNICELELRSIDMAINAKKSCTMRIGPRHDTKCTNIIINNQNLPWVDEIRYLGIFIVRSCKVKISLDNAKRSFHRSLNAIFGKVGRIASEEVVLHLVHSKCLPILLYGLEACPLTKTDCRRLDFVVMRFLMKLFCTSNSDIVNDCRRYFDFKLPSETIQLRTDKFLLKLS